MTEILPVHASARRVPRSFFDTLVVGRSHVIIMSVVELLRESMQNNPVLSLNTSDGRQKGPAHLPPQWVLLAMEPGAGDD